MKYSKKQETTQLKQKILVFLSPLLTAATTLRIISKYNRIIILEGKIIFKNNPNKMMFLQKVDQLNPAVKIILSCPLVIT